ncbi:ABC transporter substrate-binding protein [Desertihabitans aurantiacus]|uniref:ABC transporter substrate-binding protein n=1 Tax=Desertihabitans aurantiacus TaxID=2282477 RepID=UPI000DF83244|nr:ABC transporter substrate-binding protein [Desertihabitans aurantiacus]
MSAPTTRAPGRPVGAALLSRRSLLATGGGLAAAMSLSSCSFFETSAVQEGGSGDGGAGPKGKEAPSLAARVEAGELPPVEERLPANPMVVQPLNQIGRYGGTWRSAMITQEDATWLTQSISYEPMVRWIPGYTGKPGTEEIIPNICESFEELDDGRVFQFTLRRGMRWSDGEPLTVEDFRFTFEDVLVHPVMHPTGVYALWTNPADENKPARFESEGDVIRYVFDDPKPGFLEELAANTRLVWPKHYMQQFHADYNPDIDQLVEQAGLNDWVQLWEAHTEVATDADVPTLDAWMLTSALGDGTHVTAVRNPYYWKVDPEGSQLPYIEDIRSELLQDIEVELLKIVNGEIDMQMRNFGTIRNLPVVADNQESGGYRMFTVTPQGVNAMVIGFNQTLQDEGKAAMYANKDFRVGLSHAINRQRIIDTVYAGQTKPWQCAPMETSPVYDEEFGTQFTEYSPEKANQALDAAGYTEKDGEGFRLRDGERVTVSVLVPSSFPDHIDAFELIKQDWAAVGVDTNVQTMAETLYWERVEANQAEAGTWTGGGFEVRATQGSNHYYLPSNPRGSSRFGHTWALWYRSNGAEGEEPPADVKRQLELFDQMRVTYDADEATALGKEIIAIAKDRFFYIGICTEANSYGIVRNDMEVNVPDEMSGINAFQPPGPTNPEQYFFTA